MKTLANSLDKVTLLSQRERAKSLAINDQTSDKKIAKAFKQKANDWSEIRPEWGLAGNYAIIIGKRELTRDVSLSGRVFLHEYRSDHDADLSVLRGIMTAPVIVAHWINMQYYASAVAPDYYGSGNKQLHNVVSSIGCISGGAGDLLIGLSKQSLYWKDELYHNPIRLQVIVESTPKQLNQLLNQVESLKKVVENDWFQLMAIDSSSRQLELYMSGKWCKI